MADESENILLNIEFNSADIQKSIAGIATARESIDKLLAANKALADQGLKNSAAYVKNQESIKALNTEVSTNSKVIQANTQAVKANEDSIKSLKEQNKQLLKDRDQISTKTEEGRAQIEKLNAKYDENSKIIAKNSSEVEKQRFNIGNYQSALDGVVPGLGKFATGLDSAVQGTDKLSKGSKAFIGTGIGLVIAAVGLALGALMAYFKGSEEGQNKLNKIMAIGSAIMEQFMNVAEAVGEAIFNAIENPQQAIKNFGNLIKENIINRFEGLMELIPAIGKAINLLFEGEFSEAGKVAFDAVAKVATGIEDASGKIGGLIDSTNALVQNGIDNGKKLSDLTSKIDKDARQLEVDRANTSLKVSKLRADAVELEGAARRKAIKEAIALEEGLSAKEVSLAKTKQQLSALKVEANGNDKDALNELATATAAVAAAEETAFGNTLKFKKELQGLDEADAKLLEEIQKKKDEINSRELKAQDELALLRLEAQAKEIIDAQGKADKLIEIEQLKAEQLLANTELTESERAIIAEESAAVINEIQKTADEEKLDQFQEELDLELEAFAEYTQGLINEKKRELLEGTISQEEYDEEINDLLIAALETQLAIKTAAGDEDLALETRIVDAKIALSKAEADAKKGDQEDIKESVKNTLANTASVFNKQSIAFKALSSALALINTYESAVKSYNAVAQIPIVGPALGFVAAAAAVAAGLAQVAKINSVKVPKMEHGGVIEIGGRRHSQGGEDVHVGGKLVANVERGENMVVLKRGTSPLLRNLSNINMLAGGRDFYGDQSTRFHNADGGFVARAAGSQVSSFQNLSIAEDLKKIKIFTSVTDLERVQGQVNRANFTSELS